MRPASDNRVFLLFLLGAEVALLLFDAIYPFARHRQLAFSRLQGVQTSTTVAPELGNLPEQAFAFPADRRNPLILFCQQRLKLRYPHLQFMLSGVGGSASGMDIRPLPPVPLTQQPREIFMSARKFTRPPRLLGEGRESWLDLT